MTSTMVHIRVNAKLKQEACEALDSMGLSLSDAVRLLLVRVAAEKALPFDIRVPNARTRNALHESSTGKTQSFESVAQLMDNLHADD